MCVCVCGVCVYVCVCMYVCGQKWDRYYVTIDQQFVSSWIEKYHVCVCCIMYSCIHSCIEMLQICFVTMPPHFFYILTLRKYTLDTCTKKFRQGGKVFGGIHYFSISIFCKH